MAKNKVVIVGGGLAGLSAGCYARASGFETIVVEHNLALGGVCTAWSRPPYTIDGCIHWLTGGPFDRVYRELGILPKVRTHVLELFARYVDTQDGTTLDVTRDLDLLAGSLTVLSPNDADEILRLVAAARHIVDMAPPFDAPAELATMGDSLRGLWEMRGQLGTMLHFRKSIGGWAADHLQDSRLRRFFTCLMPESAPALFLAMTLGYLSRGWLSRPDGGTEAFRDALIETYRALGGEVRVHATVDEVLVKNDRAEGVRLADGTQIEADFVISTASSPETILRLLGGRYGAHELRKRLDKWSLFEPIVLASYGVSSPMTDTPATLLFDRISPIEVGGRTTDRLYVRVYNDDPTLAPSGHTVVQAMVPTSYDWWATRGPSYGAEKFAAGRLLATRLEERLPAMMGAVQLTDVATPLTYWNMARSWRGAYEGWMPTPDAFFGHVRKTLAGLDGFIMAGQWVEPGGGVPTAITSGRQAVQILCAGERRAFAAPDLTRPERSTDRERTATAV